MSEVPDVSPDDPSAQALRAALAEGLRRMEENEPAARRFEVDGVHQMRTATRRMRSDFRTFRPMLEDRWAQSLSDELGWLADCLGAVRDLDVMTARLLQSAEGLPAEVLKPLFEALESERESAKAALLRALDDARYRTLRERLQLALRSLPTTKQADRPCRTALPKRVAAAWRKLRSAARDLRPGDPDEQYHRVRILAKRARYAAESVAGALGARASKDAARFARRASRVQDVLGTLQDAAVARAMIEKVMARRPEDHVFRLAATRLIKRQERAARKARERFPKTWKKLDRKRIRRWLAK